MQSSKHSIRTVCVCMGVCVIVLPYPVHWLPPSTRWPSPLVEPWPIHLYLPRHCHSLAWYCSPLVRWLIHWPALPHQQVMPLTFGKQLSTRPIHQHSTESRSPLSGQTRNTTKWHIKAHGEGTKNKSELPPFKWRGGFCNNEECIHQVTEPRNCPMPLSRKSAFNLRFSWDLHTIGCRITMSIKMQISGTPQLAKPTLRDLGLYIFTMFPSNSDEQWSLESSQSNSNSCIIIRVSIVNFEVIKWGKQD